MKTNVVFTLFLIVTVAFVAGCQPVSEKGQPVDSWATQIAGSYKGSIWSGQTEYAGTTEFHVDAKGLLSGTYELDDQGTMVPGKLSDCRVVGHHKLECKWEDKNGTGKLTMTFADNLSRFDGLWNADGEENKHAWNGTR